MDGMPPSQTVENYLKAILMAQAALPPQDPVPMGQVAAALGVVPRHGHNDGESARRIGLGSL